MPISCLTDRFAKCKAEGKAAFVAYLTAGFDTRELTVDALLGLEEGGADVIEVGVPFSDPMADGPVIERAGNVALANGVKLADCFEFVKQARQKGLTIPVLLMTYLNPILSFGLEKCCEKARDSGVDGFIPVDLPHGEGQDDAFLSACKKFDISSVPLLSPTSGEDRIARVAATATSFIYCVSLTGVTGMKTNSDQLRGGEGGKEKALVDPFTAATAELGKTISFIKKHSDMPVAVGFGISKPENVKRVVDLGADGFVVGTAVVACVENTAGPPAAKVAALEALAKSLKAAASLPIATEEPAAKRLKANGTTEGSNGGAAIVNGGGKALGANVWCFGDFGGRYIPETLMHAHDELTKMYETAKADPSFATELDLLRRNYVGGPTPLYHAKRLTEHAGGAQIWFKREELAHTGAHKINNALGQALLAKKLGKQRIIAETGAGQHGVATATACALLGLECIVYMGAQDCERQKLNVFRMSMLGAKCIPVTSGSQTLKDAINEALRDWVTNIRTTHYIIGSAIGPHPFPDIVRDFQSIIGKEARAQMLNQGEFAPSAPGSGGHTIGPGKLPDVVVACVGGGSNAIGMFAGFLEDKDVELIGVEAGGAAGPPAEGSNEKAKHSATLSAGTPGVLHGNRTYLLQSSEGQIEETHSISAGLDYPGVGPQHAALKDAGRAKYVWATDSDALAALQMCSRLEGLIPALEPSHAVSYALKRAKEMRPDQIILVNLCGRGDKDMVQVAKHLGVDVSGSTGRDMKA